MKIGIITFHFPYNCGAALQCFALQTKLEELGHEVCVINYRPWYHQNRYTPLKNPIYFGKKRFHDPADNVLKRWYHALDGFCRTVHSWKRYPETVKKEKKVRSFVKTYLHETRVYRTLEQLQKNPPKCDVYIAGSDQLWNSAITNGGFDGAYFLNFGEKSTRRMTYSVGADFSKLADPVAALKTVINKLDIISLREAKWRSVVESATSGQIPIHIDLDPTLLLDRETYIKYMPNMPKIEKPYILTYTMNGETQKQNYNGARILAEKLGMHVIDVSGDPNHMNKKVEDNRLCSPDEFLWYVYHAEYIITNSFHGTVFSVMFQKKFVTIPHAVTGNRVTELLDKLGLSQRYQRITVNAVQEITNKINYEDVMDKLMKLRQDSVDFLNSSINK